MNQIQYYLIMDNIPGLSWLLLDMRVIIIIFVVLSFKIKWHDKTTTTNNKQNIQQHALMKKKTDNK